MHHVILRSEGGSDAHDNVIGFCQTCHRRAHNDKSLIYDDELNCWLEPLDMAKRWLARQIQHCPVRLDRLTQSILFEEVKAAVKSTDSMFYHSQAVYNKNHWSAYEVFLKAAWNYLRDNSQDKSRIGAILLLKMVQLYRRRSGRAFQRAARRKFGQLKSLLGSLDKSDRISWILGEVAYEEAYMRFLEAAGSKETVNLFENSVEQERRGGRRMGYSISNAQMIVSSGRLMMEAGSHLEKQRIQLLRVQNDMASIEGMLSNSWVNLTIPVHLAHIDLREGKYDRVIQVMAPMAEKSNGRALWYSGIAKMRSGEKESGIVDLELARRKLYEDCITERRAALLVGLGDAYLLLDNIPAAKKTYKEAIRQPTHMDNQKAIEVAQRRLDNSSLGHVIDSHDTIYFR